MSSPAFGQQIRIDQINALFLEGAGQYLVPRLIAQLAKVAPFATLFGPFVGIDSPKQRWADYQRMDWSMRQLPAINVFEGEQESKQSDNGWDTGTIKIQVYWPASFRRSDLARIPKAFHSAILAFFTSDLAFALLDSRANKDASIIVPGLNELGKEIVDQKNMEGIVESELVPVTMLDVRFRIDLRAFYRFLESTNRTIGQPFEATLADLVEVKGEYDGVTDPAAEDVQAIVEDDIPITS
jgi:hypothetical protein